MSLAYDLTVATVVSIIMVVIHRVGIELFAPGTPLYDLATDATHLQAASRADLWYQIIVAWGPMIVIAGVWAWTLTRSLKRMAATARPRRPR